MYRPVSKYNSRIIFQRNTVTTDAVRNRKHEWVDYFTCYAYVNTSAMAKQGAAETENVVPVERRDVTFETRYCSELACVTSVDYRIVFSGGVYNIRAVDPVNYQNNEFRFICEREARGE